MDEALSGETASWRPGRGSSKRTGAALVLERVAGIGKTAIWRAMLDTALARNHLLRGAAATRSKPG